jgi:hypothetical protein
MNVPDGLYFSFLSLSWNDFLHGGPEKRVCKQCKSKQSGSMLPVLGDCCYKSKGNKISGLIRSQGMSDAHVVNLQGPPIGGVDDSVIPQTPARMV